MVLKFQPVVAPQNGTWRPGQSGNPRGRPLRAERSAAERARDFTEDAIKALVHALRVPTTRVPAAVALLDRGWGRPDVRIHAQSESTVLHLIAAQAISEELLLQQKPAIEHHDEHAADALPKE
jgi:hypothetical protein